MSSRPALWPYLLMLAPATICINLSRFHEFHHGDSVVPILTSLYEWAPFFWESNRNGSLIPLLALPFRAPLANLLVQTGIGIFSGLAAYFVLCFYVVKQRVWPIIATGAAAQFLWLFPPENAFEMLCGCQPYCLSLVLGISALLLVDGRYWPATGRSFCVAVALMALAHWVNLGLVVVLGPLIVLRSLLENPSDLWRREALRQFIVLAIGVFAGFVAMRTLGVQDTSFALQPLDEWPRCVGRLAKETGDGATPGFWLLTLLALAASLFGVVWPRTRQVARVACRDTFALLLAAGIYFVLMANLKWVEGNLFNFRYAFPAVVLIQLAALIPAATALDHCTGQLVSRFAPWLCVPVLLLATFASFGFPSLEEPRASLNRTIGLRSGDIVDARCTHIVGNYFEVWPAVFHANLLLFERHGDHVIWGVTHRCGPTKQHWDTLPRDRFRVAVPIAEEGKHPFGGTAEEFMEWCLPKARLQESRPTILVFVAD